MTASDPNYLPKALVPKMSTSGIKASTYAFGGGGLRAHKHSIHNNHCKATDMQMTPDTLQPFELHALTTPSAVVILIAEIPDPHFWPSTQTNVPLILWSRQVLLCAFL